MWLLENDKVLHFVAGFFVTYAVYVIMALFSCSSPWICLGIAAVVSLLVSLGKEVVWDKWLGKGVPNWKDFYAGTIGDIICTIAIAILLII